MPEILKQIEISTGIVALKEEYMQDIESEQDLIRAYNENIGNFTLVDYQDRISFLQKCEYDITRKNICDSSLSFRKV